MIQSGDERSDSMMSRSRRYIQPTLAQGAKPAGYWFKQHGYLDPVLDRRTATTTGQMLYQRIDPRPPAVIIPDNPPPTPPSPAVLAANRRRQTYNNHYSEHDNRNIIQNFGEYFGRGFGKRLVPRSAHQRPDWMLSHYPLPVHPDRSVSQRDFCGWPALEYQQMTARSLSSLGSPSKETRRKSSDHWIKSCYDEWNPTTGNENTRFVYNDENKRLPIHPWHY